MLPKFPLTKKTFSLKKNNFSDMKDLHSFVALSALAASLSWQNLTKAREILKCCPESQFLDEWYNCLHTHSKIWLLFELLDLVLVFLVFSFCIRRVIQS